MCNNLLHRIITADKREYLILSCCRAVVRHLTPEGGGGTPGNSWWGVCRPVPQILTQFQTKKCNFPHRFSDQTSKILTRFETWPLYRNYVIIT